MLAVNLQILKKFSPHRYTTIPSRLANLLKCFSAQVTDRTDRGSGSNSDNAGVWVLTHGVRWFSKAVKLEVVSVVGRERRVSREHPG